MFRKRTPAATATAPKKRIVVVHQDEEDEIIIVTDKVKRLQQPSSSPPAAVADEENLVQYSKAHIAELKSESIQVKQPPSNIAPTNVFVSGEEAIKLIQQDDDEEEEEAMKAARKELKHMHVQEEEDDGDSDSGFSVGDEDDDKPPTSQPYEAPASLPNLLSELEDLQTKLVQRQAEFQSMLSPTPAQTPITSQQRLEYAQYKRHQVEDLKLYAMKMVSCCKTKLHMLKQANCNEESELAALWSDVREEFASAQRVAQRFAVWFKEDEQEFKRYWGAKQLARLLYPFVLWRIKLQPHEFPFQVAKFQDWPEIAQAASQFAPSFSKQLAAWMAFFALQEECSTLTGYSKDAEHALLRAKAELVDDM